MSPLTLVILLAAAPPSSKAKDETVVAMKAAFQGVMSLQPYLTSSSSFRDPANAKKIASALQPLSALQHRFMAPQEPGMEVLGSLFAESVNRARADFSNGNSESARMRLRAVTSLCFACHTRERSSKNFDDAAMQVESLNLAPLRKAEFFATTRQFDRAIEVWNQALATGPKNEADAFEQAAALRQYIAVLVRVKDDRAATVGVLTKQVARKDTPLFIIRTLERWLVDAQNWQADAFDAKDASPAALFAKAKAIVDGSEVTQSVMSNEGQFISVLRASGYLHAALEQQPRAPFRAEALYLLGVTSAASLDPLLWELDGLYLGACVRENPHTPIARRCVDRLYERTWFGWTGSGGTHIPPDLAQHLANLRALAQ